MSFQQKQKSKTIAKILAGLLMAFLIIFNIQISFGDNNSEDLDLFGVKVSSFVSESYATVEYGTKWRSLNEGFLHDTYGWLYLYKCDKMTLDPQCKPFELGFGYQ